MQVLDSFVKNNVDSYVLRCLTLAVLRQHVAVALGFVALALVTVALAVRFVALALTLLGLLTSLRSVKQK